jgi:hypothetical protein
MNIYVGSEIAGQTRGGSIMKMIYRFCLAAAFVTAPTLAGAHNELAREPRGVDTIVPASSAPPADSSAQKIVIYTAKTIVTLDPGTPSAEAVAVMNGKILGAGTLDEVRGWITIRNSRSTDVFRMR